MEEDRAVSVVVQVVQPEAAQVTRAPVGKVKVDPEQPKGPEETVAHQMAEPGEPAEVLALAARVELAQHLAVAEVAVDTTAVEAAVPTLMAAAPTVVVAVADHLGTTPR